MLLVAVTARASLPPLPANMPLDDAMAPEGMPPLPRVITTDVANPQLSALEAEGRGKIVSSPLVVTVDRMKAIVEQGTELPYQAKVGQGVSGVQFRRATLKLEVEPQITPDGRVVLDLDVAKDSVGEQTASGPAINTCKRVSRWKMAGRCPSLESTRPTTVKM
jgi:hypothetical protein